MVQSGCLFRHRVCPRGIDRRTDPSRRGASFGTRDPDSGPGAELLEYLVRRDGRPYPADARANDLFNWATVVISPDALALRRRVAAAHYTIVSSGPARSDEAGTISTSFVLRDPDGHTVQVVEERRP